MRWEYRLGQAIGVILVLTVGPVVVGAVLGVVLAVAYHVLTRLV